MKTSVKRKSKTKGKPAVPSPAAFTAAIAAFRHAQDVFYHGGLNPPELDEACGVWSDAKAKIISMILAANGQRWDFYAEEYIEHAAVILPDGTVLSVRPDPGDTYGYPPYAKPALAIVEPGRVAKL